jgi:hypothetical protein
VFEWQNILHVGSRGRIEQKTGHVLAPCTGLIGRIQTAHVGSTGRKIAESLVHHDRDPALGEPLIGSANCQCAN